ncbi:efflux RND transporter permease subunit [Alkalilimnicola sp. S0819]|uniref:efflux RND transporter permease subunit n=1 Tax=Alkalilimnicola sp. S0819 TaxID=2613922 RepID=UPI001261EDBF|nr:efflux RND transporter permease subunit [Alkalilimnicola sp. S0819]KAB7627169.1 efflux RND transporter permease subunit [Alkalilimnicola sp. S0819]MPQ15880.1 efflux RND transporter permease subunit [Alkalilimnicola sp. S0819]
MARFFTDRPVFAWVIALFIMVAGLLAIGQLPVSQYPDIAPPTINIRVTYPGADAETLDKSVVSLIEQELNGADGLLYVGSESQANGMAQINATFVTGTDPDLAQVDIQNRIKRVESRLPAPVTRLGVRVSKSRSNFLMFVTLSSTDGRHSRVELGDYISRNVLEEIKRIPGVGQAQLFGTERAMRVWLQPDQLVNYRLTPADVLQAIRGQNTQVAAGTLGSQPSGDAQSIVMPVVVSGQLSTPEAFGNILLRAEADGSVVRLRDVARIELGGQNYQYGTWLNGSPNAAIGVQLSNTGNALETAQAVRDKLDELSRYFPEGVRYDVPNDTSRFVGISILGVVETLVEAVILVFLVMYLFLQNLRATLIPTLVVPVALLGSIATMLAMGFSINVLTMFGLVLAIGILVDDAIVVVENVERIMSEEGLSPREATLKAMRQVTGAIVGITLVLTSVFIPMAFFAGSVGVIYRQFSLTLVASMLFSALMALSLTPALCATLLKPVQAGHQYAKSGFFGWFNRGFSRLTRRYQGSIAYMLRRSGRFMVVYLLILVAAGLLFSRLPESFVPAEDQGYLITNIQLPAGASAIRTEAVLKEVEAFYRSHPAVENVLMIRGFSFSGRGDNAGLGYVTLKPWDERGPDEAVGAVVSQANARFSQIRDAIAFAVNPPPIRGLGNASGFSFRLQDRAGHGHEALLAARGQLLGLAAQSPVLSGVRPEGLADAPQLRLDVDREVAAALGVSFEQIAMVLGTALGSSYVNDFPNLGRQQQVVVQADPAGRMQPEDLQALHVRNAAGEMLPLGAFTEVNWQVGPMQLARYNGYPTLKISGSAAEGRSTGEAMLEMERLMEQLPAGFGYEWTGQSLEEKRSGAQAPALFALSLLAVFLCLAALYESWSVPAAVMLVVPLGILGALLATFLRDLPNDVYFKVGLIAIIGLSSKNAILIIEFAKDLQAQGRSLADATLQAVRLRFRPILMTSLAFGMGVVPLVLSTGAGSASQRAIGTAVFGGIISATVLAVFLVPVFYVVVRGLFRGSRRQREFDREHSHVNPQEDGL